LLDGSSFYRAKSTISQLPQHSSVHLHIIVEDIEQNINVFLNEVYFDVLQRYIRCQTLDKQH